MFDMKKILFLAVAGILFLSACKKETIEPTEMDLLTSKGWVMTSMLLTTGSFTYEVTGDMEACELDDIAYFKKEGSSFERNQGATKCFEEEAQHEKLGTWTFNETTKELLINIFDDEIQVMELLEVKEDELKLFLDETPEDDEIQTCVITFVPAS
jgi:hypothetical protein